MARQGFYELWGVYEIAYAITDMVSELPHGAGNLVLKLRPSIQHTNYILQIVTHDEVVISSPVKCFELGRDKVNRIDQSDLCSAE